MATNYGPDILDPTLAQEEQDAARESARLHGLAREQRGLMDRPDETPNFPGIQFPWEQYGTPEWQERYAFLYPDASPDVDAKHRSMGFTPELKGAFRRDSAKRDRLGQLHSEISQSKEELSRKSATLPFRRQREDTYQRLREKEKMLRGYIGQSEETLNQALESQLDRLLGEVGYRADTARLAAAQDFASRGLLRSSFAQKRLNDLNLNEQEQRANTKLATDETRAQAQTYTHAALDTIDRRREKITTAKNQAELDTADRIASGIDVAKLQNDFQARLTALQIGARDQAYLMSSLAGLTSNLGGLFGEVALYAGKKDNKKKET